MKKASKWIIGGLAFIILLCLLMAFEPVAAQVSKVTTYPVSVIQNTARTVLFIALGAFLIYTGVAALAVPVVGVILIVSGLALVAMALYPFFSKPKQPTGTF